MASGIASIIARPGPLTRGGLFAGLCVLGAANGVADRITSSVSASGPIGAILETCGISVLVWVAFWMCPSLMLEAQEGPPTRTDFAVAVGAFGTILLPMAWPSWIALTGIAIYLLGARPVTADGHQDPLRRAAWILLATTTVMYWGRLSLIILGEFLLTFDASLVGLATGSPHSGNTVRMADGEYLWVEEGCSSLSGISLVILCWTLISQWRALPWSPVNMIWCGFACIAVSLVNVGRMSLMVLFPDRYDLIHGPIGAAIAGWVTLGLIVSICLRGVRNRSCARA